MPPSLVSAAPLRVMPFGRLRRWASSWLRNAAATGGAATPTSSPLFRGNGRHGSAWGVGAKNRRPRITPTYSLGFPTVVPSLFWTQIHGNGYIRGMEKPIDDLKLISVAEAAVALNVSTRTIIRLIAEGSIDAPKIRRRRLISISSLRQFLGLKTD